VDKITVVCHKDHDKGYEDYVGKCLLCEVERLQKRDNSSWVGLTDEEIKKIAKKHKWHEGNVEPHLMPVFRSLEAKLKEKNGG
jgi:hypothetical protein